MSPPRHLQLGVPEPQCPPQGLQASAQQLPVAQGQRRRRCPPPPRQVLPGSETSGQQLPAGDGPGLMAGVVGLAPPGCRGSDFPLLLASLGNPNRESPWRQENGVSTFLSLGPVGPSHPEGNPLPLNPVWICHQGLISIGPCVHSPRQMGEELAQKCGPGPTPQPWPYHAVSDSRLTVCRALFLENKRTRQLSGQEASRTGHPG